MQRWPLYKQKQRSNPTEEKNEDKKKKKKKNFAYTVGLYSPIIVMAPSKCFRYDLSGVTLGMISLSLGLSFFYQTFPLFLYSVPNLFY